MLKITNLTKIYHNEDEGSLALSNISVSFPETGFVAITGESGSGKTTLLNVLSGFLPYEEGDFYVDDVNFLTFTNEDLENYHKNDIGFVFQDYHLIETHRVIDNLIESLLIIGLPYKKAKKKAEEYLKKIDLYTFRNNKARQLSSGQKQKLSIIRAIIKEPRIVFCDEPTANLDVDTGLAILEILKEYSRDHLVIVSTHSYEYVKQYATHFMRLYKGRLTSFEMVKESEIPVNQPVQNDNSKSFGLFFTSLRNQIVQTISKIAFFAVFVATFVFVSALFAANMDISSTKILSRDVFNNINQNEILVIKKNREAISNDEIKGLTSVSHVCGTQLYGLATEMNYFYRENTDYEYQAKIVYISQFEQTVEYVFAPLSDDLYIRSYDGLLNESEIVEGALPSSFFEVAANKNYKVGDEILVYFNEPVLQGNFNFQFTFTVSGIFDKQDENLYFSNSFIEHIDYLQFQSNSREFRFGLNTNLRTFGRPNDTRNDYYVMSPIYKPSLGPREVQVSKRFLEIEAKRLPKDEDLNFLFTYLNNDFDNRIVVTYAAIEPAEDIPPSYIYVGEDIYHSYIDKYKPSTSRVYIDNYSFMDDVISDLTNQQFDCLSPYRAGSMKYDPEKQDLRAIILISSTVGVAFAGIVYFFFGYLFERNRINEDNTFSLLGCSRKTVHYLSLINIAFATLLGIVLGFGIYFVLSQFNISFISDINLYLRFYHFIIVAVLAVILGFIIWRRYVRAFDKKISAKKGSVF